MAASDDGNAGPTALSLVICTYDDPVRLKACLRSVQNQSLEPLEVIIADDGSPDSTLAVVRAFSQSYQRPVKHVWTPHEDFRRAMIMNRAFAQVDGDYVVQTDGDCVMHRHFLRDHRQAALRGRFVIGRRAHVRERWVKHFSPRLPSVLRALSTRNLYATRYAFRLPVDSLQRVGTPHVLGANLSFWADDLRAVNGYHEGFRGWGHEDQDLARRLTDYGLNHRVLNQRAILFHLDHPERSRASLHRNSELLNSLQTGGVVRSPLGIAEAAGPVPVVSILGKGKTT